MSIMTMQQTNIFVNTKDGFNFYPASNADANEAWTETEAESVPAGKKRSKAGTDGPVQRKVNGWMGEVAATTTAVSATGDLQVSPDFKQRQMRL